VRALVAPDIINISATTRQRIGLLIEVLEFDRAFTNRDKPLVALLIDPASQAKQRCCTKW